LKLSIVIPAHNEADCIAGTVEGIHGRLPSENISFEILVINDHSTDDTEGELRRLAARFREFRWLSNERAGGFGLAIQTGLESFLGDAACIVMADASDDPNDVVKYYYKLLEGYDCVFGSRFMRDSVVTDYPVMKLVLNRIANIFVRVLFGLSYNDVTNAFKCYRREVIDGLRPLLSHHFNITLELPLKAIVRGYSYAVVPTNWHNRTTGVSKFKIKEMGSRYLFIVLYALIEKLLSRGDYRRPPKAQDSPPQST
jgi:dolichol-phosphate mannosyltransferase